MSDPERLTPRKSTGAHSKGGWVGPRSGLDVVDNIYKKKSFTPPTIRNPNRPSHSLIGSVTTLPRLQIFGSSDLS